MIVKCEGPQGQPGVRFVNPDGPDGECHTWDSEAEMGAAVRAAQREANAVASNGDPRMARDG